MDVHKLLEGVKDGEITIGEAEQYLKDLPYQDLGFCRLDHHRALRSGFGEAVYCPGKATEHLIKIYQCFAERKSNVLGTRASKEQYEAVKEVIPDVIYDPLGRTLKLQFDQSAPVGEIVVCTAGTSDISVAEEAAQTAEFFGAYVNRIYDVGVAGIHRLLAKTEEIRRANGIWSQSSWDFRIAYNAELLCRRNCCCQY